MMQRISCKNVGARDERVPTTRSGTCEKISLAKFKNGCPHENEAIFLITVLDS